MSFDTRNGGASPTINHADRADEVFATIDERLGHLTRFIDGYAQFARLPAPRREETTWAGLGLALCREIVEGHGWRISLQQRPAGGTIVSCWFPQHSVSA